LGGFDQDPNVFLLRVNLEGLVPSYEGFWDVAQVKIAIANSIEDFYIRPASSIVKCNTWGSFSRRCYLKCQWENTIDT
jgi:hypothetical protein